MSTKMNFQPWECNVASVSPEQALGLKRDANIALGFYCYVIRVADVNDPSRKMAFKRLKFLEDENGYRIQRFLFYNEVRFLKNVQHPNIIQVEQALVCPGEFVIVTEYHPTNLFNDLRRHTQAEVSKYFSQVVDALLYLHDRHIVHGDVNLQNVLIDTQGNAKLCDFGMAQFVPNKSSKHWGCYSTIYYDGPEYIRGRPVEDAFKLESFSLGVCLCALSLRVYPRKDLNYLELLRAGESVPDIHRICAERLLCPSPTERASISEIHHRLNDHRQSESHAQSDVIHESPAPVSVPTPRECSHVTEEYRNFILEEKR
ncbi:NUAK family SNF1-like kinase 1 [Aplysia californica]|uniref:NUAK family SNF1-like kinase 1 n=1 Tax=Aplysia californica TaxID=6500 RepID=A0ABM0K6X8_APLCA|nr:NUAK family SNF1-like kinase 1 [Aplysia californica]